jgi:ABC-type glycerol-3-phosphate transport system permease component
MRVVRNILAWSITLLLAWPLMWVAWTALTLDGTPTLVHLRRVFADHPMATWLANSLVMAGLAAPLGAIVCSAAGFALAKCRFRGRRTLLVALIALLALPAHALLPATFEWVRLIGLIDSRLAVVLPATATAFGVLLYRQAFVNLPDEVLDAARLDGAGDLRLWWQLALPAVRPVTATFVLFGFLIVWNGFLWPAVVLSSEQKQPLAVGMNTLVLLPEYQTTPGPLMAAVLLGAAVPLLLFWGVQRDLEEGLARTVRL